MQMKQLNNEILYPDDQIIKVGRQDIEFLKEKAGCNKRKRIRLCAHMDVEDKIHEMLIVHAKNTYVRPHKHLEKSESFHVIEGSVDVVVFNESGDIIDIVEMGDYLSGRIFYFRISDPYYHTILITSDFLVFHETTKGPFKKSDTVFAPWAPDESNIVGQKKLMERLSIEVMNFKGKP